MDWLTTLEKLAPTIASVLASPVAGMAVASLEAALGVSSKDSIKEVIESGQLNGDQVEAIKQAEIQLKAKGQELGLNFEELAVSDRKSARDMQSNTKSKIPPVLAVLVTIGFFGILIGLMLGKVPPDNQALMIMLGSLGTAWISIITFYFGSSASSQAKDLLIHNSTPIK